MKPNKFKVSVILFLKSGTTRKVDWVEDALMKKVKAQEGTTNEPLTLQEALMFFQQKFKEWKDKDSSIIRLNVKGEHSLISFKEVEYATFNVTQEEEEIKKADITQHPAFKSKVHRDI